MSILKFLFKPRRKMAKKNTPYVNLGRYHLTTHCQNRIVERNIKKQHVLENLFCKPNAIEKTKTGENGSRAYNRVGKRYTTSINPDNYNVATIRHISKKEIRVHKLRKGCFGKYEK